MYAIQIDNISRLFKTTTGVIRLKIPLRLAPPGVRPVLPSHRMAGRALPVRHYGSVDIFLEAMGTAQPGDVLVIDNAGRLDEGCIGDLTALEARACGLSGIVVWGAHRDTFELEQIDLPIFSYGAFPAWAEPLLVEISSGQLERSVHKALEVAGSE